MLLASLSEWPTKSRTIGETLVPVSKISTQPNRGLLMGFIRPCTIGERNRLEREIAFGGVGAANQC